MDPHRLLGRGQATDVMTMGRLEMKAKVEEFLTPLRCRGKAQGTGSTLR
jgi:hypothetical protein